MPAVAPPTGYVHERAHALEAARIVAPHYEFSPETILGSSRSADVVQARRIVFLILRDVTRWRTDFISTVTGWSRPNVIKQIGIIEGITKSRKPEHKRLKAIVDACLKEAAGGA